MPIAFKGWLFRPGTCLARGGHVWLIAAVLGLCIATLVGCAGQRTFNEGNAFFAEGKTDAGLAKLEQAIALEPNNSEFRIALVTRRASLVNRLVAAGDVARREGRGADAETAYAQVLGYDTNHGMARQGLEALAMEARHRQLLKEGDAIMQRGGSAALQDAMAKLRTVLLENPNHRDALNLKARINEQLDKQQRPEAKLSAAYRKPITLEFRDAPLRAVFDVIAKVTGLNFYFDKDIRPDLKATILAKNTSIEDAVRLLLATNQLEQRIVNENSILIYPNTPQKLKDYQPLSVRSFFLANADVKAVSNSIKTIVKTKDLVVDERLGLIIMRDTPEAIRVAERIVALQDLSDPEVMLDVEVLEIKRSRLLELGVRWPGSLTLAPLPTAGGALTLEALRSLNGAGIQATIGNVSINANQQDQTTNTLANPRIRVRNKEKAKILIGDRVPVISTTSTSTGFVSESVNYVDVGLKLEVEPSVYLDDEVAIKISLEVSTLGAQTVSRAGSISYQIGTRGANTVLRLRDGETQILAGLISDEDRASANRVPGIGALPVVGRLFGSQSDDRQRSEILLSITPRILRSIRRPDHLLAEFESGTESSMGAQGLRAISAEPATVAGAETRNSSTPGGRPTQANNASPSAPPSSTASTSQDSNSRSRTDAQSLAQAGPVVLSWRVPSQVRVGEQITALIHLNSNLAIRDLSASIGYDPRILQLLSVADGSYFVRGDVNSTFSHRDDATQGRLQITALRQSSASAGPGITGEGGFAMLTFKALSAGAARLQLLSAAPEPAPPLGMQMPIDAVVEVLP